jgi:hypothetical protein
MRRKGCKVKKVHDKLMISHVSLDELSHLDIHISGELASSTSSGARKAPSLALILGPKTPGTEIGVSPHRAHSPEVPTVPTHVHVHVSVTIVLSELLRIVIVHHPVHSHSSPLGTHVPVEGHIGTIVTVIRTLAGPSGWILYGEYVPEERGGEIGILSHLTVEKGGVDVNMSVY